MHTDAESAAVIGPHLHRERDGLALHHRAVVKLQTVFALVKVMEQLVETACHVQRRTVPARALAALHGVERDGGIQAERQRFGEEAPVHAADVGGLRACRQQQTACAIDLRRHSQRSRVIVAGPHGDDAKLRTIARRTRHQAVHHLVDKAVAAKGHHRLRAPCALGDGARMAGTRRAHHGDRVLAKRRAQVRRRLIGGSGPRSALRSGVGDQKDMS